MLTNNVQRVCDEYTNNVCTAWHDVVNDSWDWTSPGSIILIICAVVFVAVFFGAMFTDN